MLGVAQQGGVETDVVKGVLQQRVLLLQIDQCPVNTLSDIGHVLSVEQPLKWRQRARIRVQSNCIFSVVGSTVRGVLQYQQCQEVVTDLADIGNATD